MYTRAVSRDGLNFWRYLLNAPPLVIAEIEHWHVYGDLVYGSQQDAFETQWL